MTSYTDQVFAPVDADHVMERLAGGNETEVYLTEDRRYVVKVKHDMAEESIAEALQWAKTMRQGAEEFAACLGPEYSIPSYPIIARNSQGQAQVLVIQPFVTRARQLYTLNYDELDPAEREHIARQLRDIIRRALGMYRRQGSMPDLYGRSSTSSKEREQLNAPHMLPWRLWSFLVKRNLLRSHNLMITDAPEHRIVLIDYDIVRRSKLYRAIYYAVRWLLFWRDHALILLMQGGGPVPQKARPPDTPDRPRQH
jgi:hypothetical protein